MGFLNSIWNFFATYILRQAPYMIGFITLIGYALMKKKWYDILGGTLKAIIGMLILIVGSGGLVSNFRPILAGLKDRFNLTACVIDPYYGQNAVTAGVEEVFGKDEDGEDKIARLFFTLAAANPDEHLDNINQLMNIFCNEELLDALMAAETPEDILQAEKDFPPEDILAD